MSPYSPNPKVRSVLAKGEGVTRDETLDRVIDAVRISFGKLFETVGDIYIFLFMLMQIRSVAGSAHSLEFQLMYTGRLSAESGILNCVPSI